MEGKWWEATDQGDPGCYQGHFKYRVNVKVYKGVYKGSSWTVFPLTRGVL